MTTSYTPLLGFALPVEGELDGAWGDVTNDSITSLVESAIAGSTTASVTSANWTLSTTGSGLANESRMAILIPTGTPGVSRNIIAPASSKLYVVVNQSNAAVVVKGAATTGATVASNTTAAVAWNGSDFALVGGGVNTVSVVTANGLAGTVGGTTSAPVITLSSTITGLLKANGTAISAAVSGTDYAPATSGTGILKGNGAGGTSTAVSGTDYAPATSGSGILKGNGAGGTSTAVSGTDYAPATSGSGILKGNGAGGTSTATAGTDYVTPTGSETLTNKRITPRINTTASTTTLTINSDTTDQYTVTALAVNMAIGAPTGTPTDGQKLIIRILDNGTVRSLSWDAAFRTINTFLPSATVANKTTYVGCLYNTAASKWDVVGVMTQA